MPAPNMPMAKRRRLKFCRRYGRAASWHHTFEVFFANWLRRKSRDGRANAETAERAPTSNRERERERHRPQETIAGLKISRSDKRESADGTGVGSHKSKPDGRFQRVTAGIQDIVQEVNSLSHGTQQEEETHTQHVGGSGAVARYVT